MLQCHQAPINECGIRLDMLFRYVNKSSIRYDLPHGLHKDADKSAGGTSSLYLDSTLKRLSLLLRPGNRLCSHDASAPVALSLLVLIRVALLDGRDEFGELGLVLLADFGEGEDGGCLMGYQYPFMDDMVRMMQNIPSREQQHLISPCPSLLRTVHPSFCIEPVKRSPTRSDQRH